MTEPRSIEETERDREDAAWKAERYDYLVGNDGNPEWQLERENIELRRRLEHAEDGGPDGGWRLIAAKNEAEFRRLGAALTEIAEEAAEWNRGYPGSAHGGHIEGIAARALGARKPDNWRCYCGENDPTTPCCLDPNR